MEDPSEEYWEVDDYSQPYESKGKLRLIWTKGLNLGKKMVITGVVISSAPFVVPPLMALSAIGFAFSVPAGFAFVTYACSEKLMNKLLPMPSLPPLEEDEMVYTYDEEDRFYEDDVDSKGYQEDEGIDSEEREFEDDMKKEVEMRIELVEERDEKIDGYDRKEAEMRIELVEQHDEKFDDYDRVPVDEIVEEDEEKPLNVSGISEEEMRRETTGLIEEMRDEGKYDQQERRDIVGEETTEESEEKREIPIKDVTENKGIKNDLFVIPEEVRPDEDAKAAVTNGSRSEEILTSVSSVGTNEEVREMPDEDAKGVTNGSRSEETLTNVSSVGTNEEVRETPDEDAMEVTNGSRSEETMTDLSSVGTNEEARDTKPEGERKLVVQVKRSGNRRTATDVRLETSSDKKTGILAISDVDARETADESGLDLFDQVTPSPDQTGDLVNKTSPGVHEVLIETTTLTVSEHSGAASSQSSAAASPKVKPSEEKIWAQINAMRTIVGYKAAPHSSCVEELKALYVFTGVEPPPSSKDHVDLVDIDEKLHFLMSIVGVK